jgi:hypothetical protein
MTSGWENAWTSCHDAYWANLPHICTQYTNPAAPSASRAVFERPRDGQKCADGHTAAQKLQSTSWSYGPHSSSRAKLSMLIVQMGVFPMTRFLLTCAFLFVCVMLAMSPVKAFSPAQLAPTASTSSRIVQVAKKCDQAFKRCVKQCKKDQSCVSMCAFDRDWCVGFCPFGPDPC